MSAAPRTLDLLRAISLPTWKQHPWRNVVGLVAIALGVALAFSVHLINESALSEFSAAVRSATGQVDAQVVCGSDGCPDTLWDRLREQPEVRVASPVVELETYAQGPAGERVSVRLWGLDALSSLQIRPEWTPRPAEDAGISEDAARFAGIDPDRLFLNAAALKALQVRPGQQVAVQRGTATESFAVSGTVAAGGGPALVMDIAGVQARWGQPDRVDRITRIDLRLTPGASVEALAARWGAMDGWPAGATLQGPQDGTARVSTASRAYRVNLTVLALVALFVGAFLVFSVQSLSVAQRTPTLALLGVLGLAAADRRRLIISESVLLGCVGSALGLALGTAAAVVALRWLSGDLGGGYFPGIVPPLRFSSAAAAVFGGLGIAAAVLGGWLPARQAETLPSAQALKGLGTDAHAGVPSALGPLLMALGGLLSLVPPLAGLPLAAYAAVALLLAGGIASVPGLLRWLLRLRPAEGTLGALGLLAWERARDQRHAATVAVAGVVASLSLSVALTIMVSSFRTGVTAWLDQVLPADLYVRTAGSSAASDGAFLPPGWLSAAAEVPGVRAVEGSRIRALSLDAARPTVSLIARPLHEDALPWVEPPIAAPNGDPYPAAYVTEAMVQLYGAQPGSLLRLPVQTLNTSGALPSPLEVRVLGVWRDYARQFGAIAIDLDTYRQRTGDTRLNDAAIRLQPGAEVSAVQTALRGLVDEADLLEFGVPAQIRALSLRIFDRSFAVTYYLQALAIGIGLFGIAASFSAQVLARRKEFGLLRHLGLTRGQVVAVVAGEGAAWTGAGALAGLALGTAVSAVLVHVVNPQSFHWTMELQWPVGRLMLLSLAVWCAGTLTAALAARTAAAGDAVRAVKEDW